MDTNVDFHEKNLVFSVNDKGVQSGGFRVASNLLGGGKALLIQIEGDSKSKSKSGRDSLGLHLSNFTIPFGLACSQYPVEEPRDIYNDNVEVLPEGVYDELLKRISADYIHSKKSKTRKGNMKNSTKTRKHRN